jgi:uncharacterized protein YyaL (SSP411 family)
MAVNGAIEVALAGDRGVADFMALARTVGETYVPSLVLAGGAPGDATGIALLADRPMREGKATAYVCHRYVCDEPVTDSRALWEQLQRVTRTGKRP